MEKLNKDKIMDSEIEKYVTKQNQLEKQIQELVAEKKMLQNRMSLLNECLSNKKIKQKISQLEYKQNLLKCLESVVNKIKIEITPLNYLKHLLNKQLMVSSSSTTNINFNIEEQNYSKSSEPTTNSECAIETLDSLSDVDSEGSVMVLSEYDIVSDDEVSENTEKSNINKVIYDEALQMASSVHSFQAELPSTNIESIGPLPNVSEQNSDMQSDTKETIGLINTSNKVKKLLETCNIAKDKDLISSTENAKKKLGVDKGKIESIIQEISTLSFTDDSLDDVGITLLNNIEHDNLPKLLNNSWVKVDMDELPDISMKSEQCSSNQTTIGSQKDNIVSNANLDEQIETHIDKLFNHQLDSKENYEITNLENIVCNDVNLDHNYFKNEIHNPLCSTKVLKDKTENDSSVLNIQYECNELKVNSEVENTIQNDQMCSFSIELKENSEVKHIQHVSSYNLDHTYKDEIQNLVSSNKVLKNKTEIDSSLLTIKYECNEPKVNTEVEINNIINNPSSNHQFKSDKTPMQLHCINEFNTLGLNFQLLNGIRQHGFQRLMNLQQQCISHCINGRDIVLHSYPCAGKSIMSLISVLQRINTSINECQAIILVPTLELALFTQKIIKSLGKFLNVLTCIGGTNVPRKVSPVPHVVISTPQDLCDMINCNSLSKDFIKMLIIDDAGEMITSTGFFNKIRHILLFLKNDRQLIILSTSKLEEILDHFSDTMRNPEYIIMPDEKPSLDDILQYYINVPEEWKFDALCELYTLLNLWRTVVYCNTWNKSLALAENLRLKTCTVSAVHNEMDTSQRHLILHQFRSDISRVLVTTGLLKGEDFSEVIWVINYDLPKCPKDYVRKIVSCFSRRIKVINFITSNDKTSKENIETTFNMHMLCTPQDLTDFILTGN